MTPRLLKENFFQLLFTPPGPSKEKRSRGREEKARVLNQQLWASNRPILKVGPGSKDVLFLEDVFRGVQILGATGSGKTSASGEALSMACLSTGFGGLVLCVKADEAEEWRRRCERAGRNNDFIRISPDAPHCFNFLDWESKSPQGNWTINLSNFLLEIMAILERQGTGQTDPFWNRSLSELLNNAIVLERCATGGVTIAGLKAVVDTAPRFVSASEPEPTESFAGTRTPLSYYEFKRVALAQMPTDAELQNAILYFETRFAELNEKTRSIVITSLSSMFDPLLRPPLKNLFCNTTTLSPDAVFEGKIVVVDLSVHRFRNIGRMANLIWKTAFKKACERRENKERPVFLWIDESQYLVDDIDVQFQTTARSLRCATVLLTQNVPNYVSELGNRSRVESLLGSLHTKIFHQNDDIETNKWAMNLVGQIPLRKRSESKSGSSSFLQFSAKTTVSETTQWDHDVPARVFTNLKAGGKTNNREVEAIVYFSGKKFSNGKPWLKKVFHQNEN